MDPKQYGAAQALVPTLRTDDLAAFQAALHAKGFPIGQPDTIEWWNATPQERAALVKLVAAGPLQAKCKLLLENFCKLLTPDAVMTGLRTAAASEFDRAGWLQYFYTEAKRAAAEDKSGPALQALVDDIGNSLFFRSGGNVVPRQPLDQIDDRVLKQMMGVLLTIGFERVPATKAHVLAGDSSSAMIMDHLRWAGDPDELSGMAKPLQRLPVEFKWRCDSRPYDEVARSNGFATKSNSDGYARSKGLREAWHPFSDEGTRSYMWFRKGQTDNCLYNVVSVGTGDWPAFVVYPKIELSGGKVAGVRGYLGTRKLRCRRKDTLASVTLDLPVSETYLYLFLQLGTVFDTGAAQGKTAYPEVGMHEIPMRNIFGALRFVRYHLGSVDEVTDADGMVVVADPGGVKFNDDDAKTIAASCGDELFTKCRSTFDTARNTMPRRVAWASSGSGFAERKLGEEFEFGGQKYTLDQTPTA